MNKKQILTTTVVLAILGLLVYFQVQHWRRFDWARFRTVSHVDPLHIAAAIVLIYLTYVLRALRWKVFLEPVRKASTWKMVPPTFIGFTGLALLGRPGQTNYGAAKAGLIGLARSLAREVSRWNITVNCLNAGLVETELTAKLPEATRKELLSAVPLGRMGRPEEIAAACGWLCSEGASYITGQVFGVDGGLT